MTEKSSITKYIYYRLISPLIQNKILNLSAGSTFGRINLKEIRSLNLAIPSQQEQKRISNFLTFCDNRITSEEKFLEKLLLQKRGLMADLLTGKVRVPETIIPTS